MNEPRHDASIARLTTVLAQRPVPGVVSVYVFGSVAEGRPHRESDLDIGVLLDRAVYPDPRARFEAQLELRRHLAPGAVGREADVVVLNDAPPLIARRISRGIRVHCADETLDHAWQRDVQLRAADVEPFIRKMRQRVLDGLTA